MVCIHLIEEAAADHQEDSNWLVSASNHCVKHQVIFDSYGLEDLCMLENTSSVVLYDAFQKLVQSRWGCYTKQD